MQFYKNSPYQLLLVGKWIIFCLVHHLIKIADESPKRIKTCCKADCKVDCKQDNKGRANKRCGLREHPIPADEQEKLNKKIIHDSYLQQFVYCVLSIMDCTILFCICQVLFLNLTRKFLCQIFPFCICYNYFNSKYLVFI